MPKTNLIWLIFGKSRLLFQSLVLVKTSLKWDKRSPHADNHLKNMNFLPGDKTARNYALK